MTRFILTISVYTNLFRISIISSGGHLSNTLRWPTFARRLRGKETIHGWQQGFRSTIVVTRRSPSCLATRLPSNCGNGSDGRTWLCQLKREESFLLLLPALLRKYVIRRRWIACFIKVRPRLNALTATLKMDICEERERDAFKHRLSTERSVNFNC